MVPIIRRFLSVRPETHADRSECLGFTAGLPTDGLHVVVAVTVADFRPMGAAYTAARVANEAAATKVALDTAEVHTRSNAFSRAFDRWVFELDAVHRKGYCAATLPRLLGTPTLGTFVRRPDWEKVARLVVVAAHVREEPAHVGDPRAFDALIAAGAALEGALAARGASVAARTRTARALKDASALFDRAYGKLVKNVLFYDPAGLGTAIPRFLRASRRTPASGADLAEGVEVGALPDRGRPGLVEVALAQPGELVRPDLVDVNVEPAGAPVGSVDGDDPAHPERHALSDEAAAVAGPLAAVVHGSGGQAYSAGSSAPR